MMKTATYPSTIHTRPFSRVWQSIHILLARGLDVLHTWEQRSSGRRALRHLDDRLLKDIEAQLGCGRTGSVQTVLATLSASRCGLMKEDDRCASWPK